MYAMCKHSLLVGRLRRPKAVGYPHVGAAFLILPGCYPDHQEFDELAALLEGVLGVPFDLGEPPS